ncbi:DUF3298 and DUF4163 domain-containing protein [Saliterribacillus persicus]|uniref:Uncharacterized protein DUF3298 n=1 Tax=Saliterribacillus persicus TaxID=930114 RepID=A0A368XTD0_9BACI|nr:DUF3298 and DUF4163 domain-containing protein [Saliterribacillus persicus]RCW69767.1 uncharacterized protein DUF3298 [Saliterribacillus persicus]
MRVKGLIISMIGLIAFFALFIQLAATENTSSKQTATVTQFLFKDKKELPYPQVSEMENKDLEKKINKDFKTYAKASYTSYKENKREGKKNGFPADYQAAYEVKYNQQGKLSILTSNYMFSGGAHGNTIVESFNYDEKYDKRIYLTDILTTEEQIEAATDYVWKYALDRPEIFYPDLKKEDIGLTKDTAFFFTEDSITLVFQQYEIAPYVSGNQEITLPKEITEGA